MSETVAVTGKRAQTKAANRQAILTAARHVFAKIGYDAASIRDIIRATSLASGTFYNYFKSKEEVFEAIADDSAMRIRPLLQNVRKEARDLESYIHAAYTVYFQFLADENDEAIAHGAPHLALIGVRIDTPEMQAVAGEIRQDLEDVLHTNGYSGIDTDYLAAAAIGIAREMGDYMLRRRPVDAPQAARFATQLVLSGLGSLVAKSQ